MESKRETILAFLKMRGHATLGEIASQLEISKQGALRHLEALEEAGLAALGAAAPHVCGRPQRGYHLTPAGGRHLSDRHRELIAKLVHFCSEEQLQRTFQRP